MELCDEKKGLEETMGKTIKNSQEEAIEQVSVIFEYFKYKFEEKT